MSLRIIAGQFGGRTIATSDSHKTHPMGDRIRSSLFNILGDLRRGMTVLDAFAGSGSLGFEALSRGGSCDVCRARSCRPSRDREKHRYAWRRPRPMNLSG